MIIFVDGWVEKKSKKGCEKTKFGTQNKKKKDNRNLFLPEKPVRKYSQYGLFAIARSSTEGG